MTTMAKGHLNIFDRVVATASISIPYQQLINLPYLECDVSYSPYVEPATPVNSSVESIDQQPSLLINHLQASYERIIPHPEQIWH